MAERVTIVAWPGVRAPLLQMEATGSEQSEQPDDDQVDRHDVVQQTWYDQDQYACDKRYERREAQCHVHG